MKKAVSILGSTGSIGTQALDVADELGNVKVLALTANNNIELLKSQIYKYKPELVAVMDEEAAFRLKKECPPCKVCSGMEGIIEASVISGADIVINSLVGGIGLVPTIHAIESGKDIGLANKETLVVGGELVMKKAMEKNVLIYPIDSEHSAILQCLGGNDIKSVRSIYLTASGGPFRGFTKEKLKHVTVAEALRHPNWVMGKKITIDSATMMNKGFEVIEAKWLFDIDIDKIKVITHPQSVIHSMVEYSDGSVMAQLGLPDMRVPISYALSYPARAANNFQKLDFFKLSSLTFEEPDYDVFPCLGLAFDAIKTGGTMPCVLNCANEISVAAFLEERIKFMDIPRLIKSAMDAYTVKNTFSLKDIEEAERFTLLHCETLIENMKRND